ncbi:MAG: hypothetical protein HND55_04295 [Pseudomonadota bacterium]|nr:MAG: hypothetical protein HND55_04295 [Pseudomonadota bacterium]
MLQLIGLALLLLLGLVALAGPIKTRFDALGPVVEKLESIAGWLGLAAAVWGLLGLIGLIIGIGGLFSAPLSWFLGLAAALALVALGLSFGLDTARGFLPTSGPLAKRFEAGHQRLQPLRPALGAAAFGLTIVLAGSLLVGGGRTATMLTGPAGAMEGCVETTSASGHTMMECPVDELEAPEGIRLVDGRIESDAHPDAFMRTDDFAVSLGRLTAGEVPAFYGRGRVGYFRGDIYLQGIVKMGEIIPGHSYQDTNGNRFDLVSNEQGHLEVKVGHRVIAEVLPNGVVQRDGQPYGQVANVDFYRRSEILPLFVIAYHQSPLFKRR